MQVLILEMLSLVLQVKDTIVNASVLFETAAMGAKLRNTHRMGGQHMGEELCVKGHVSVDCQCTMSFLAYSIAHVGDELCAKEQVSADACCATVPFSMLSPVCQTKSKWR